MQGTDLVGKQKEGERRRRPCFSHAKLARRQVGEEQSTLGERKDVERFARLNRK